MLQKTISGFFDISNDNVNKIITGIFDIDVNNIKPNLILNIGDNQFVNFDEKNDYSNYKPQPITGIIKETINNQDIPISDVRVSFIKDYLGMDLNGNPISNQNYTANTIIMDYCLTDHDGKYTVYLPPGNYTIRIDGGKYAKYFDSQTIPKTDGLINQYYLTINGLIKSKYEDIIEFNNTTKKLISGTMLDQNDQPLVGSEIIISKNNEVLVYVITNNKGKYSFALDSNDPNDQDDKYDIRMRGPKQPIQFVKGFKFLDKDLAGNKLGFISQLQQTSNLFKKDNWFIIK